LDVRSSDSQQVARRNETVASLKEEEDDALAWLRMTFGFLFTTNVSNDYQLTAWPPKMSPKSWHVMSTTCMFL